jgi:hypothetical protein
MNQREFVTNILTESSQADVLNSVIDFLASKGVETVRTVFGFVPERDLRGEKQRDDAVVPITELRRFIEDGMREGTIEWGGTSDFRFCPETFDFEVLLCNDSDLHFWSPDPVLLLELSRKLFTLGIQVYEGGSLVATE